MSVLHMKKLRLRWLKGFFQRSHSWQVGDVGFQSSPSWICVWVVFSRVGLFAMPWTHQVPLHLLSQARLLEWVPISYSRGSSQPRDRTYIYWASYISRQILCHSVLTFWTVSILVYPLLKQAHTFLILNATVTQFSSEGKAFIYILGVALCQVLFYMSYFHHSA